MMIEKKTQGFTLRDLQSQDAALLESAFSQQGWNKPASQYCTYLDQKKLGQRDVVVACLEGEIAGYVTVLQRSEYEPFSSKNIPEISDLNVLKKFQRKGLGKILVEEAERIIKPHSLVAGLGVGVLKDYGPAMRLYVKLGYMLDGNGPTYRCKALEYGEQVKVDDDLLLWMTKNLVSKT